MRRRRSGFVWRLCFVALTAGAIWALATTGARAQPVPTPSASARPPAATATASAEIGDYDFDYWIRTLGTLRPPEEETPAPARLRRPINWPFNILGYLASALVFATFWMKVPMRLRQVAIGSNVVFIAYGAVGHLYPILILHALLLPLNTVRLREMLRIAAKIERSAKGDLSADWLRPVSHERLLRAGEMLFEHGAPANEFFYVVSGTVRLLETGVELGPGELSGFVAAFAPEARHEMSAWCETDVDLLVIEHRDIMRLCHQNPDFTLYVARLLARHCVDALDVVRTLQPAAAS